MGTPDELRELTRQSRLRLAEVERLRAEQRLLTAQTDRRLREGRAVLDRAEQRPAVPPRPTLSRV